jgi:hypothetical protein
MIERRTAGPHPLPRAVLRWPLLIASSLLLAAVHPRPCAAELRDTTAAASAVDSLRGTTRPLPRGAGPVAWTGRCILAVPYTATRAVTWPLERAAVINEKHRVAQRVARIFFWKYGYGNTEVGTFFGYETGIGVSLAGLTFTAHDFLFPGSAFRIKGGFFTPEYNRITARFLTAPGRIQLFFAGRFDNRRDRPFYGIGPGTPDEVSYTNTRRLVTEGGVALRPGRGFSATLSGFTRATDLSSPGDDVSAEERFPDLYGTAETSRYAGAEAAVAWDGRNNGPFSSSGALLQTIGGFDRAVSTGDEDYEHYSAEAQGFLDLYNRTRVLALRAFAEGMEADRPDDVPYTEMEHLGGKYGLRGFSRDRFTGLKMLQLTAEYRYRLTEHVFGSLFGDWGAVAGEWEDFHPRDLESAAGFGLLMGRRGDRYALSAAKSREGYAFYLGVERIFAGRSRRLR